MDEHVSADNRPGRAYHGSAAPHIPQLCELADPIPHVAGEGQTYAATLAREFQVALEYGHWERCQAVIEAAKRQLAILRKKPIHFPVEVRLSMSLEQIGLSGRVVASLNGDGIWSVGDLVGKSAEDLFGVVGVSGAVVAEVRDALANCELKLRYDK